MGSLDVGEAEEKDLRLLMLNSWLLVFRLDINQSSFLSNILAVERFQFFTATWEDVSPTLPNSNGRETSGQALILSFPCSYLLASLSLSFLLRMVTGIWINSSRVESSIDNFLAHSRCGCDWLQLQSRRTRQVNTLLPTQLPRTVSNSQPRDNLNLISSYIKKAQRRVLVPRSWVPTLIIPLIGHGPKRSLPVWNKLLPRQYFNSNSSTGSLRKKVFGLLGFVGLGLGPDDRILVCRRWVFVGLHCKDA